MERYLEHGICHIGVEIEGFVYSKNKERINVYDWLGGSIEEPNGGVISTDLGMNQIEFSLDPCQSNEEVIDKLNVCMSVLPKDWTIYWEGVDPFADGMPSARSPKNRTENMFLALEKEEPTHWQQVKFLPSFSALNLHFEMNPSSEIGVKTMNWLNNQAPILVHEIPLQMGLIPTERFYKAWRGWADPRRLPHYLWFSNGEHLEEYWKSIPCLSREVGDDEWEVDLKTFPEIGDLWEEKSIWWEARPRWAIGSQGTIEWRTLDSMPLDKIPQVIDIFLTKWKKATSEGGGFERLSEQQWWQMVENSIFSPV